MSFKKLLTALAVSLTLSGQSTATPSNNPIIHSDLFSINSSYAYSSDLRMKQLKGDFSKRSEYLSAEGGLLQIAQVRFELIDSADLPLELVKLTTVDWDYGESESQLEIDFLDDSVATLFDYKIYLGDVALYRTDATVVNGLHRFYLGEQVADKVRDYLAKDKGLLIALN